MPDVPGSAPPAASAPPVAVNPYAPSRVPVVRQRSPVGRGRPTYRDNAVRTRFLVAALAFIILVKLAAIWGAIGLHAFACSNGTGPAVMAEANAIDHRTLVVTGLGLLGLAIAGLGWCLWVYRAYANAGSFGKMPLAHSPGMAVGMHFIPILNLERPWSIICEIWRRSAPPAGIGRRPKASPLIHAWWATWLGSGLFGWIVLACHGQPRNRTELASFALAQVWITVASLAGIVLTLLVVLAVERRLRTCAARAARAAAEAERAGESAIATPAG